MSQFQSIFDPPLPQLEKMQNKIYFNHYSEEIMHTQKKDKDLAWYFMNDYFTSFLKGGMFIPVEINLFWNCQRVK